MKEELYQFEKNKVWTLTTRSNDHPVLGTKWVFKNIVMFLTKERNEILFCKIKSKITSIFKSGHAKPRKL